MSQSRIAYRGLKRRTSGQSRNSRHDGSVVRAIQLDPDEAESGVIRRKQRRTRASERVEHDAARLAERLDERPQHPHRLLGGMQAIAGISPIDHIGGWFFRQSHIALGQQAGLFMLVADETD